MKRYFLSYNVLTKDWYLDYGCFDRERENLGKIEGEKLIKKLKEILPSHKQILIYGEEILDNFVKKLLLESFKNTRVKLEFKKNLESLC